MRVLNRVLLGVSLIVAAAAGATENYHEPAFNADSKDKFDTVAASVKSQMEPGGRYQYVKPAERQTIEKKLDEMSTLFEKNDSVQSMSQPTKIELFNDQEIVNSILTQRDGERVICKKDVPIGSHIPITTCHSYAQEQEARKDTVKLMDSWTRTNCADGACLGTPSGKQ